MSKQELIRELIAIAERLEDIQHECQLSRKGYASGADLVQVSGEVEQSERLAEN